MIVGIASGIWIRVRIWRGGAPKACPASTISLSTWRMPSSVRRTPGGIANTIVDTMPGTTPMLKKNSVGIR